MTYRYILTICFCICFMQLKAQTPYRCLIPGDTSFFMNKSTHYLRAVTIDSIAASGTDTLYYPFRSLRGAYDQFQLLDSNGGSWLGKQVAAQNDGTWRFDTYWGDTVTIKTQAAIGASWIFYNDSSSDFYTAAIYATDTFSFGNVLDSIKKIRITAFHAANANPSDPLNNLEIWLSKYHGFAKVLNLHLFPFHAPGQAVTPFRADLYMDVSEESPYYWGKVNTGFDYITYVRPTNARIYDVHPGDVFQYQYQNGSSYYYEYITDTVTGVATTPSGIQINLIRWSYYNTPSGITQPSNGSLIYPCRDYNQFTHYLPEHDNPWAIYYYPVQNYLGYADIGYRFYAIPVGNLQNGGYQVNTFEPCPYIGLMQPLSGIGDVDLEGCISPGVAGWMTRMTYAGKNGQAYGTFSPVPLGVTDVKQNLPSIKVHPNPASDEIHFTLAASIQKAVCSINDLTGRMLLQKEITTSKNTIDVSMLAPGLYILHLTNGDQTTYQKIEIKH